MTDERKCAAVNNTVKWIWAQQLFGAGTLRAHKVLTEYGTPAELLELPYSRLMNDSFFTEEEKKAIADPDFSQAEKILEESELFGAVVLTPDSAEYPESLRNIHSMPMALYTVGDVSLLNEHYLISMVGTRNPDEYGIAAAKKLSCEIASLGGIVVSGLAYGIDGACHRAALEAGGRTIAFIAGGLDLDYPKKHHALRALIERPENGLVVSEYPLTTQAYASNFPMRNRLISGVSMATVIVECSKTGGTMLTAAHAITQNKDLFAVPASILSEIGAGCNYLLTQGAEPAVSGADILLRYVDIYGYPLEPVHGRQTSLFSDEPEEAKPTERKPRAKSAEPKKVKAIEIPQFLNQEQQTVMKLVAEESMNVSELCERASIPASEALALITQLELFGLVKMMPGRIVKCCIS